MTGRSIARDRRTTAARADIADVALASSIFAPYYSRAALLACGTAAAMLHDKATEDGVAVSQLLPGEGFAVLDVSGGWAWGYCEADQYVGYVMESALVGPFADVTHIVTAATALRFAAPDIKAPLQGVLPIGSRLSGMVEPPFLALSDGGHVHLAHVAALGDISEDPVAVAMTMLGLPYLWGGRGGGGIDCSGLVQVALARCGIAAPRDSDQQRDALGTPLPDDAVAARGDLVFFPGHVGMMVDADMLIHANAHAMAVTIEPFDDVVARVGAEHERPILARRRLRP